MSVGTIALFVNWLVEGRFRAKYLALKTNYFALSVIGIFIAHLVGLLWTSDYDYGLHDVKIKLPILIIPIVLGSLNYLNKKSFLAIFLVFVAATFISSLISVGVYINLKWVEKSLQNHREISVFISHIRLSLMIVFSIVGMFYFLKKESIKRGYVFAFSTYFVLFLMLLQSVTGLALLLVFAVFLPILWGGFSKKTSAVSLSILVVFGMISTVISLPFYTWFFVEQENPILEKTALGNFYRHDLNNHQLENGYFVWRNISDSELKNEWENQSDISIDSSGKTGQPIKATLIRYLTSKHLTKDAEGLKKLKKEDVKNIENGLAHYKKYSSIFNRLDEFFFELSAFKNKQNPSNNSFGQRIFAWNLSFGIIKENVLFGVGTGDVNVAFEKKYAEQEIKITKQIRAHNQILTFIITLGFLGLITFVSFLYFSVKKNSPFSGLKFLFLSIVLFSFLFEDTLESQAGVTFFAFFVGLFSSKTN